MTDVPSRYEVVRDSHFSDWTLLGPLWLVGMSGLVIELVPNLSHAPSWGYWVLLLHVAVAMELLLLAPFMKFAHVLYRPVALLLLALAPQ